MEPHRPGRIEPRRRTRPNGAWHGPVQNITAPEKKNKKKKRRAAGGRLLFAALIDVASL
jgi:hypothetical protein